MSVFFQRLSSLVLLTCRREVAQDERDILRVVKARSRVIIVSSQFPHLPSLFKTIQLRYLQFSRSTRFQSNLSVIQMTCTCNRVPVVTDVNPSHAWLLKLAGTQLTARLFRLLCPKHDLGSQVRRLSRRKDKSSPDSDVRPTTHIIAKRTVIS